MDGESNSLEALLNKEIKNPPTSAAELQARLAARSQPPTTPLPQPSAAPTNTTDAQTPNDDPRRTVSTAGGPNPRKQDRLNPPPGENHSDVSLTEVAALLSRRVREFEAIDKELAAQKITLKSLDGRIRLTVTGDGRPVSLQIDRTAVTGPERDRLGPLIANLITTARQQAELLRKAAERRTFRSQK